jgi:hypothetical protein
MMRTFYTLADYPHEWVEIECAKCGRHGRLRTARLIEEHQAAGPVGDDRAVPEVGQHER